MKTKRIYLDNAATTPTDARVVRAMSPYLGKIFGNPGGLHKEGVEARKALSAAREKVARILQARREEIIFTSGGTEGDNMAVRGVIAAARAAGMKKPHIVTTAFEHSAVLETCKALEVSGEASVAYVRPDENGIIQPAQIKAALKPETVLVSVIYANNEIGTIQPIREISRIVKEHRDSSDFPVFHTDAVQAANYLDICPNHLGADLMTLAGSKIYGPKGSGVLYVRHGTPIAPVMRGGEQESGLRPGTEPVYLAVGFAEALKIAADSREKEAARLTKLRDYFIENLLVLSGRVSLNGDPRRRLPNNANICIDGIDNEFFVIQLDNLGVACATRSACKTNDDKGSHVILSLGKSDKEAKESIRFSFGRFTTKQDLGYAVKAIGKILK